MKAAILRVEEAARRCGLSRSMLFSLKAKGDFPQSVRLTSRTIGFLETEIEAWIQQRVRDSRSQSPASDHREIADEDITEPLTEFEPTEWGSDIDHPESKE